MNLNKYKWMAVLPMVFTACQQEALVEELPMDSALSTITCSIGGEQADSRAQIVLGNKNREQEIFHWNKGDEFTLFQTWGEMTEEDGYVSEHYSYNYHIDGKYSDSAPANTAQFSLDGEGISNVEYEWNWIAFYPTRETYSIDTTEDYCKLEISNTMTDNTESSWQTYFRENMYMMSYGTADKLSEGVNFKHLCGIVRITYTNATNTDHELNGIYVDGTLGYMQEYEIHQPALLSDWASSNMHGITFTDKATVAAGESADFYILYFRPTAVDGEIKDMKGIKVDYGVNGTSSMSQTPSQYFGEEFSYNGFQPGLCSWFKITGLDNNRIVWTRDYNPKDDEGQGGQQPGQGDEVNGATARDYTTLISAIQNSTGKLDYTITLDNSIELFAPIVINNPIKLDLNGKTIKLSDEYRPKTNMDAIINASARLEIMNGTLATNDKVNSPWHQYYIKNDENLDGVHLNGVTLSTGNAVTNAICAGANPFAMDSSEISTNGYAIYWKCNEEGMAFDTTIEKSKITGNIYYETTKSSELDVISIKYCEISGDLESKVPENISIYDVIRIDKNTTWLNLNN